MQIKFAAYVFPNIFPMPELSEPFHFDDNTFLFRGSISQYLSTQGNEHWKEWLGTIFWEELTDREPLICITWQPMEASALNGENIALSSKLNHLYHALILTGPWKNDGRSAHTLTGTGQVSSSGILSLEEISEVGHFNLWRHSHYYDAEPTWSWQVEKLRSQNALDLWKSNFLAIEQVIENGADNFLLTLALMAFHGGLHDNLLDFRIPNFVRSIEAIVGLPAGQGKVEFARRTGLLLPPTIDLPLGVDQTSIGPILKNSYQVRSDSVHGKPFADTLRSALGINFQAELPKYELGIEMSARYVIQNAITNANFLSHSSSRNVLENAWADGTLP